MFHFLKFWNSSKDTTTTSDPTPNVVESTKVVDTLPTPIESLPNPIPESLPNPIPESSLEQKTDSSLQKEIDSDFVKDIIVEKKPSIPKEYIKVIPKEKSYLYLYNTKLEIATDIPELPFNSLVRWIPTDRDKKIDLNWKQTFSNLLFYRGYIKESEESSERNLLVFYDITNSKTIYKPIGLKRDLKIHNWLDQLEIIDPSSPEYLEYLPYALISIEENNANKEHYTYLHANNLAELIEIKYLTSLHKKLLNSKKDYETIFNDVCKSINENMGKTANVLLTSGEYYYKFEIEENRLKEFDYNTQKKFSFRLNHYFYHLVNNFKFWISVDNRTISFYLTFKPKIYTMICIYDYLESIGERTVLKNIVNEINQKVHYKMISQWNDMVEEFDKYFEKTSSKPEQLSAFEKSVVECAKFEAEQ